MILWLFVGAAGGLVFVVASMLVMRWSGYYTGPLIVSPLRYFRLADTPLRIAQGLGLILLIPYLVLVFTGHDVVAQLLFGLWAIVVGSLYRKSRGFPFWKLNPKWTGLAMTLFGVGILALNTAVLFATGNDVVLTVALGIDALACVAGIAAYVLAFRHPLRS